MYVLRRNAQSGRPSFESSGRPRARWDSISRAYPDCIVTLINFEISSCDQAKTPTGSHKNQGLETLIGVWSRPETAVGQSVLSTDHDLAPSSRPTPPPSSHPTAPTPSPMGGHIFPGCARLTQAQYDLLVAHVLDRLSTPADHASFAPGALCVPLRATRPADREGKTERTYGDLDVVAGAEGWVPPRTGAAKGPVAEGDGERDDGLGGRATLWMKTLGAREWSRSGSMCVFLTLPEGRQP